MKIGFLVVSPKLEI